MLKEKRPRHRAHRHARPLARPADDRRRRGRGRRLRAEADQRRRRRRAGDARRRPQAQARRAGRHAAPQHAAPDRGARTRHQGGPARQGRATSRSTATTTCGRSENPPDTTPPDHLDYEMWTGPAPMRPVQQARRIRAAGGRSWNTATASSATCASTCSTWCAGCSTSAGRRGSAPPAASSWTRTSKANISRHADGHVRLRRPAGRLDAPHLGRPARPEVPVGRDASTATRARSRRASMSYDFIPRRRRHAAARGRDLRVRAVSRRTTPRRTSSGTSRRPSAAT